MCFSKPSIILLWGKNYYFSINFSQHWINSQKSVIHLTEPSHLLVVITVTLFHVLYNLRPSILHPLPARAAWRCSRERHLGAAERLHQQQHLVPAEGARAEHLVAAGRRRVAHQPAHVRRVRVLVGAAGRRLQLKPPARDTARGVSCTQTQHGVSAARGQHGVSAARGQHGVSAARRQHTGICCTETIRSISCMETTRGVSYMDITRGVSCMKTTRGVSSTETTRVSADDREVHGDTIQGVS